jgi:hypothetical protein
MDTAQHTNWIRQMFQYIRQDHEIVRSQARWKISRDIKFNCVQTARNASCDIRRVGIYPYALPTA